MAEFPQPEKHAPPSSGNFFLFHVTFNPDDTRQLRAYDSSPKPCEYYCRGVVAYSGGFDPGKCPRRRILRSGIIKIAFYEQTSTVCSASITKKKN